MKKTILALALLMGAANFQFSTFNFQLNCAYAQDEDFLFEFATADGTIIPDGSVVTITKAEVATDGSGDVFMDSGVFAKNVDGDDDQLLRISYEVLNKDNGDLQICFPFNCIVVREETGATTPDKMSSKLHSISTEWFPSDYGTCTVKIHLESVVKAVGNSFVVTDEGPGITLRFVYSNPDAVSAAGVSVATPVAYYSLSGQRLTSKARGAVLVRMSDGRVVKRILK